MSSIRFTFTSDGIRPLSWLTAGDKALVVAVVATNGGRADRLLSLGVTPGARITMLQTFPGIVFLCDETELAVERAVAAAIIVGPREARS
ncbi:MAG TPA: FeoA family protein [Vicinamibacterales bacterium]|jgi:Fe2+ transport system protein FeoA